MPNNYAIVLAAGKGTRMKSKTLPKVLFTIDKKPMIVYVIESLKAIGIDKPIIVIGYLGQKVKDFLGGNFNYVMQRQRLGTGHAVAKAREHLIIKPVVR